jgi:Tol biopolymer transport system component
MTEESGDERFSIWIYDILRSRAERLTFGDNSDRSPIWSPDGTRILYGSNRPGGVSLCVRPAGAAGNDSVLFTSPQGWIDPSSWSPTGDFITFRRVMSSRAGFDIWVLPMRGRRIPTPYLQTPADEGRSSISPDGRWLAYESNELGRFEIYVQSFPNSGVKYQVSSKGGRSPSWSRDGRELFYEDSEGNTVSVPVRGEATLQLGPPAAPSKRAPFGKALDTPSGIRFLGIRQVSSDEVQSLTVVQNWPEIARGRKDP